MRHPKHVHATQAFASRDWARVLALLPAESTHHPEDIRMCAIALSESGRPDAGLALLEPLLEAAPSDATLQVNAASIERRLGRTASAESRLQAVVSQHPRFLPAWLNLANLRRTDARLAAAAPAYRRVLELDATHVPARVALAEIDKALGNIDGAVAGFREALRLRPACGAAWWGIANLKTRPLSSEDRLQLDALWASVALTPEDREPLGFARASAIAAHDTPDVAWQALLDANAFVARRRPFDAGAFDAQIATQLQRLESMPVPAIEGPGAEVVFIVGLPRSGSTLLEQMLAAHPTIAAASELPDLPLLVRKSAATTGDAPPLAEAYRERTARWRNGRYRHVDKWPANFLHVADILEAMPGARIVECRRDARDNALSCLQQYFAHGHAFSYSLDAIARYGAGARRLMDAARNLAPAHVLTVEYETLVRDPESELRRVLAFLGMDWNEGCLNPERVVREVRTASAAQVREPVDQRGIGRHRRFAFGFAGWTAHGPAA